VAGAVVLASAADAGGAEMVDVFGDIPAPDTKKYIVELSDLELFLLRITLPCSRSSDPGSRGLEQVRDNSQRALAVERLGAIANRAPSSSA